MGSCSSASAAHEQPRHQVTLPNFIGNLSARSFLTIASSNHSISSSRPWSRVSRRRWTDATLNNRFESCKTAWPVPRVESYFLPEFKISSDARDDKFKIIGLISQGAFGKVYKVKKSDSDELLALKVLNKSKIIHENAIRQVKDEVHIQEVCGHNPFIVASQLRWQSRKRLYIVSEYVPGGELANLLEKFRQLPEEIVRIYVAEISIVLDFLHNAGIIYRDLKPENLLLNAFGHLQLIDFGLSKWLKYGNRTSTLCGTLHYMAPEVLNREPYGHAADWWSLGVLTCRMLTDQYPNTEGDRLEGLDLSKPAHSLLMRLLEPAPQYRLKSIKAIQETAFFMGFNFAEVRSMKICPNDILKKHFPNGPPKYDPVEASEEYKNVFSNFDQLNMGE